MAQETITRYTDDIDGSDLADVENPTISFTFDNVEYEIDLGQKNRDKLEKAVAPYIEAARKVAPTRSRGGSRRKATGQNGGATPADIRKWAQAQGIDVPSRGRIPQEVRDAYDTAN